MATFFSKYPKLLLNNRLVTDIIARTAIRSKYTRKLSIYYPYQLQEGDTPEIIASKYYGDPEKHWIVMLANETMDAFFDFPLGYHEFEKYLDEQYKTEGALIGRTGSEYAKITINVSPPGYRAIITTTDNVTSESTINKFYIDEKAFNSEYADDSFNYVEMTTQFGDVTYNQYTESFTIFDYESEKNEAKREINLIREEYANQLESELKILMREQYG